MRLAAALTLAGALGFAPPARALDYQVVRQNGAVAILATGPFVAGDANRLRDLLRRTPGAEVVMFQSPGGNAMEGMAVGRVIRQAGLATHLVRGIECASACTYAFLGGRVRTADPGARYGVHMFSLSGNPDTVQRVQSVIRQHGSAGAVAVIQALEEGTAQFSAQLAYFAIEMGVSLRLLDPNFNTSHSSIRWLTPDELRRFNVVNAQ
jgi:hypothetical protein